MADKCVSIIKFSVPHSRNAANFANGQYRDFTQVMLTGGHKAIILKELLISWKLSVVTLKSYLLFLSLCRRRNVAVRSEDP